mgnify:CR=1 FL=1
MPFLAYQSVVAALGALANHVREARHGDRAFYNRNVHLNFTNVCVASCKFCSFARPDDRTASEGYTMPLGESVESILRRKGSAREMALTMPVWKP